MKELTTMIRKVARFLALAAVLAIVAGIIFGGRISQWLKSSQTAAAAPQQTGHDAGTTAAAAPDPNNPGHKVLYWYDAMNPQRRYDKPGKAPDGMDLVPKYAEGEEDAMANMPVGTVKISAQKQQLIGVRTATVQREELVRTLRTVGQVTADERKLAHIHLKVSGWVEDVYADYVGQLLKKGQPLFTIYSPDLLATEEEYLIAKRGETALGNSQFPDVAQGSRSLLQSSRERLKLWDISDEQIKKLDESRQVTRTMTYYSPIDGFIMERKAYPHAAITPDTDLYTIADLSDIWVNAEVYEFEVPYVRVGQTAQAQLSYYPGKRYTGKVTYIYPTVDPVARTVKVRLEFPNPNFELKPQMFANVEFKINYGKQILLPQEALLDSGEKQYVFLAHGDGMFEPRPVETGAKLDGKVMITSGLKPGDTVVLSGNFLIDSESRLKSAMGGMKH
jgi:Cu(I)/Ag(I) efflux system membrane fusion protein